MKRHNDQTHASEPHIDERRSVAAEEVRGAIEAIRYTLAALTPEQRAEVVAAVVREGSN